jgi:hypothetical protein
MAMTVELVKLAWRAVMAATPSWTLWFGLTGFMVIAGSLTFFYERCRRRTYVAVLEAIQPGTLLLDRTGRQKEVAVIRLAQPGLTRRSTSTDMEDSRR